MDPLSILAINEEFIKNENFIEFYYFIKGQY